MAREDVHGLQSVRVNVGLSSIIGVTVVPFVNSVVVQQIAGSTLEIGGSGLTWGGGYIVNAPLSFNCSGVFYLAATGATATVGLMFGLNAPV